MIVALAVLVVLAVAVVLARKRYVWPAKMLRDARGELLPVVQRMVDAGTPIEHAYAYRYVLAGPGTADEGDHDTDKMVVRVDAMPGGKLVTRVAPVDRQGRRTGSSKRLLTR